jgi:hypothetical protein
VPAAAGQAQLRQRPEETPASIPALFGSASFHPPAAARPGETVEAVLRINEQELAQQVQQQIVPSIDQAITALSTALRAELERALRQLRDQAQNQQPQNP